MENGLKINKTLVARTTGLALILAVALSFNGFTQASTTFQLTVNVSDSCGPVSQAQAIIVNGPNNGLFGITDSNGQFTFNLNPGVFIVHVTAANHNNQDTGTIVLT